MQDTVNIDTFDFVYNFFNINSRKFYRRYKDAAQFTIHTQQVINTEYIAHIIYFTIMEAHILSYTHRI